jgi:hypothetical protein
VALGVAGLVQLKQVEHLADLVVELRRVTHPGFAVEPVAAQSSDSLDDEPRELLCECGDDSCIEAILVSRADYEVAMGHPGHYLVNSDHSDGTGIQVLMARDGYSIVEYQQSSG